MSEDVTKEQDAEEAEPKADDVDVPPTRKLAKDTSDKRVDDPALTRVKWRLFWVVSIVSLIADQVTKVWARASLPTSPEDCKIPDDIMSGHCMGKPVPVVESFWHWRLSMN